MESLEAGTGRIALGQAVLKPCLGKRLKGHASSLDGRSQKDELSFAGCCRGSFWGALAQFKDLVVDLASGKISYLVMSANTAQGTAPGTASGSGTEQLGSSARSSAGTVDKGLPSAQTPTATSQQTK
jgi:hypothetical protein